MRSDVTALNALVENLSTSYGWITPTNAVPLVKPGKPVEAMLARYQWRTKFDVPPANQLATLFPGGVHPGASDWLGLPAAGSTVTKTVSVNANTPTEVSMNQGSKPPRIETGLYAAPGATVNIAVPANKTTAGLQFTSAGRRTTFSISIRGATFRASGGASRSRRRVMMWAMFSADS